MYFDCLSSVNWLNIISDFPVLINDVFFSGKENRWLWKTRCFELTSNGLSVRSIISTKCVLRNTSAFIRRMEFDINDIRCIYSISLNEKDFNSTKFRLDSIRSSRKWWRWRNACGAILVNPVLIIVRYSRLWRP